MNLAPRSYWETDRQLRLVPSRRRDRSRAETKDQTWRDRQPLSHSISVRRRMSGSVHRDRAAGSGLIFDNDLLAPDFRQPAGDDTPSRIHSAPRRKANQ